VRRRAWSDQTVFGFHSPTHLGSVAIPVKDAGSLTDGLESPPCDDAATVTPRA